MVADNEKFAKRIRSFDFYQKWWYIVDFTCFLHDLSWKVCIIFQSVRDDGVEVPHFLRSSAREASVFLCLLLFWITMSCRTHMARDTLGSIGYISWIRPVWVRNEKVVLSQVCPRKFQVFHEKRFSNFTRFVLRFKLESLWGFPINWEMMAQKFRIFWKVLLERFGTSLS